MNHSRAILALVFTLSLAAWAACSKGDSSAPPLLEHSYSGTLSFIVSRDFPQISDTLRMSVSIQKDRTVTFGSGGSAVFDNEQEKNENGVPATRVHMSGTMHLIEARGAWYLQNDAEYLLALLHSRVEGQMTVWEFDSIAGWRQTQTGPFEHEDTFDDGEVQFGIAEALSQGSSMSTTVVDDQGQTTYEYIVHLSAGVK